MSKGNRYYRSVAAMVLQRYYELEHGVRENTFDPALLNYRIDVERHLTHYTDADRLVLEVLHRDGCTHEEALRCAGVTSKRPDAYVRDLEASVGLAFVRSGMDDIDRYLS